ncbi:MAG: hypothetical protein ACI9W6_001068 [Motiliproteus sp.]|jgi:hypothetical protein
MKTLIKTTLIASALFTSSLMAATTYDSEQMSHPREGIMNFGVADAGEASKRVGFNEMLPLHSVERTYMGAPASVDATQGYAAQAHCLNTEAFTMLNHPKEGIMGIAERQC